MQVEFTDTEAQAICKTITEMANDNLIVQISKYKAIWRVRVMEPKYGNIVAEGYSIKLVKALNEAQLIAQKK